MGGFNQTPSPNIPGDLKVSILSTTTLHPIDQTERRSMFLSNIDQVLNFSVETVHFFKANADHPFDSVVQTLRSAMERLLVPYDFLAGRLRFDAGKGRLQIDCNGDGVKFVVASSKLELAELGELEYPNPGFRQLATVMEVSGGVDRWLCAIKVTSFKCGGFALGISTDHSVFDGLSFQIFLKNLASLTFNKPLAIQPYTNRQLLASRTPPRVEFSHPEFLKLDLQSLQKEPPSSMLDATSNALDFKVLHLDTNGIQTLKDKAKRDNGDVPSDPHAITSFNVVVAHIWRCKVLATYFEASDKATYFEASDKANRTSTLLYAVDIRKRLDPPLPLSYTGNAVLSAYATATCSELENGPFAKIVGLVREGATRMDEKYIRSLIDWGQLHKGFPCGDVFVSSWWKIGFAEVEYQWGMPLYSCPVPHPRRDIVLLLPKIEGADKGVNVLISLPKGDMEKFQSFFYKFLE